MHGRKRTTQRTTSPGALLNTATEQHGLGRGLDGVAQEEVGRHRGVTDRVLW
jgi:hypothetical protein